LQVFLPLHVLLFFACCSCCRCCLCMCLAFGTQEQGTVKELGSRGLGARELGGSGSVGSGSLGPGSLGSRLPAAAAGLPDDWDKPMLTGTSCHLTMIGTSLCWLGQAAASWDKLLPACLPGHSHGSIQSHRPCPTSAKPKITISDMAGPVPVPACLRIHWGKLMCTGTS